MATASNTQRTPRDVVEFAPNVPVTLALKYNQGKLIAGQYGERMMFSLIDGRVMFLDPETAGQIEAAGINVRESFTITRKWDGQKGSPITWEIARVAGEQPNGTMVVPALPEAKPPQRAEMPAPVNHLVRDACAMVDAYAARAERLSRRFRSPARNTYR